MSFFGNKSIERVTQVVKVHGDDRDMDVWHQFAVRAEAQDVFEGRFHINVKRLEGIEGVEVAAGDDAPGGDEKVQETRLAIYEEIAYNTDQDKRDGHERAVREKRVSDDRDEEHSDENA